MLKITVGSILQDFSDRRRKPSRPITQLTLDDGSLKTVIAVWLDDLPEGVQEGDELILRRQGAKP